MSTPDYTGLPDWVRVGAPVVVLSSYGNTDSAVPGTITRVLKRDVVATTTRTRSGLPAEVEHRVNRDTLSRTDSYVRFLDWASDEGRARLDAQAQTNRRARVERAYRNYATDAPDGLGAAQALIDAVQRQIDAGDLT